MRHVSAPLLVFVGLTVFAPAPFPSARRGQAEALSASLQGSWEVVKFTRSLGGGKYEIRDTPTTHVVVRGDRWIMMSGQEDSGGFRIRVDATRRPAWIDFVADSGGALVSVGTLRRDCDTLRLLYVEGDAAMRPATFENAPAGCLRAEFKRKR